MASQVKLTRKEKENNATLLRRFTRRVQGTGIVNKVKNERYEERQDSDFKKKKRALTTIKRRAEYRQLWKEGKIGLDRK